MPDDSAAGPLGDYRYECGVTHREAEGTTTTRRIDLYERGCFVLEAKQGASAPRQTSLFVEAERRANVRCSPGWAQAILKAKGQAEGYARDLPMEEGWPPFVIVCDVGFCLDLYADFSGNAERVQEEAAGLVRWLRPEFQAPEETFRKPLQTEMAVAEATLTGATPWPKDVPSQFIMLRSALAHGPATAQDVDRRFKGARRGAKMAEMLATLAAARPLGGGRFVAWRGRTGAPLPRRPLRATGEKKGG